MKSIIEEASSIAKAIENGWAKAGKPKEFSIKIFEEPEKNFFGMTKRSAKVGIFYNDNPVKPEHAKPRTSSRPAAVKSANAPAKATFQHKPIDTASKPVELKSEKSIPKQSIERPVSERPIHYDQVIWTPEMIANVNTWLNQVLEIMQSPAKFSIAAERFHLKVQFDQNFFEDKAREKQFFSGLSILLFQILKITYRRPLKGFKILFSAGIPDILEA